MSEAKEGFDRARYETTYRLDMAIVNAISQMPPYPTLKESQDIYREWIEEEDGDLARTRLVSLII
jgi:hypothetical protein